MSSRGTDLAMNNKQSKNKSKNKSRSSSAANKTKTTAKSSSSAKSQQGGLSLGARIAIAVIAVVMALSMMLPSLSSIFSGSSSSTTTDQSSSADASTSESTSSSSSDSSSSSSSTSTTSTVDTIDSEYKTLVASLESKLANDPNNLATLLNLGRDYMQWGYQVVYNGTTDADTTHGNDLLDKAISYFDQYLALNDSNSVKVDSALCLLYKGDTSGAISALQQITTDSPDYGPAWANLGLAYEISGDSTSALSAYQQAETTDADDEYGAKSYAEKRIAAINSSATSTTSGTSATSGTSSTSTTQGLSDTLASKSNTSL